LGSDAAGIGDSLRHPNMFSWAFRFGGLSGLAVGVLHWLIARADRQP